MSLVIDRDPGDEHPETGLCERPWCENAALPDEDYCSECFLEIEEMLAELEFDPPEAA